MAVSRPATRRPWVLIALGVAAVAVLAAVALMVLTPGASDTPAPGSSQVPTPSSSSPVKGSPTARDDSASFATDEGVTVDVLANDHGPGDSALTLGGVSAPDHGVATIASGQIDYRPDPGYFGDDAFTYKVTTANGAEGSALVRVYRRCELSRTLEPTCGAWWGSAQVPGHVSDLLSLESVLGTTLPIAHVFHSGGSVFPSVEEQGLAVRSDPSVLFGNVKPGSGGGGRTLTWRQVANGQADGYLDEVAAAIVQLGRPVFLTIQHEPEDNVVSAAGSGYTTADYVAMYQHVVDRIGAQVASGGGPKTGYPIWVWDVTGYPKWESMWPRLYPGDDYVDWIAYDPYLKDPNGCDFSCVANLTYTGYPTWTGFYDWAEQNLPGKPLMLGEWGVRESDVSAAVSAKADLFASVPSVLATEFPRLRALVYFNDGKSPTSPTSSRIETSDAALRAFQQMIADPYFTQNRARP